MRRVFLMLFLLLGQIQLLAQENWTVIENCMGELTYPLVRKGNWDFPGIIISSAYPDGVRGIRADLNVDYYLALESDDSFPAAGAISPNGRYFAYPIGHTDFHINTLGEDLLVVDYLRVMRTDGSLDESYHFEAQDTAFSGLVSRAFNLRPVLWFGENWIQYPIHENEHLFNIPSAESHLWSLSVNPYYLHFVSPDGTRAFDSQLYNLEQDTHIDFPVPQKAFWFPDSSAFIAGMAVDGQSLELLSRDGELLDTIPQAGFVDIAIAPNGRYFAMWDVEQNLILGDFDNKLLHNLCFQGTIANVDDSHYYFNNLAWSPNGQSLAFSYDDYLVLLNVSSFENRVIDSYSKQVMAWVSMEGETISEAEVTIREPQAAIEATSELTAEATELSSTTCQLEVIIGANLRAGAGANFEQVGSAAEGFILTADGQQFNSQEYLRWWHLRTGEWIREDFTRESPECEFLPELDNP